MTAAEVNARISEQARVLGTITESLECELLNPMIKCVYAILKKFGVLPKQDISKIVEVYYSSNVHKAHKKSMLSNVQETLGFLHTSRMAKTNPEVFDSINPDALMEILLTSGGEPKEMFRDAAEVKKMRIQRQQQSMNPQEEE